jgi:hypothetical protein
MLIYSIINLVLSVIALIISIIALIYSTKQSKAIKVVTKK